MLEKVIKTRMRIDWSRSFRVVGAVLWLGLSLQACENLGED